MSESLTIKELAYALEVDRTVIWSMRHQGFVMPERKATEQAARDWLTAHPHFRVRPRKRVNRKRR